MKTRWAFLLLLPLVMTGCLWLPTTEPHKQTVQKGTPPPVDPNLPGTKGQLPVTEHGKARPKAAAMTTGAPTPITASQVNTANAHEKGQDLWDEMDWDRQNMVKPASGKANTPPWPK